MRLAIDLWGQFHVQSTSGAIDLWGQFYGVSFTRNRPLGSVLHVQDVFPSPDVYGLIFLFESSDHLIVAGIPDDEVAFFWARSEGGDLWGTDIFFEILEHLLAVRIGRIDTEYLLAFFAVEGVEVRANAVCPGLLHEFPVELVNILLMVDDKDVDDIFSDRRVRPDVVSVRGSAFLVIKPGHSAVGALGEIEL